MAYMQSNEPYQRVDESSITKDMLTGAGIGAAVAGTTHAGMSAGAKLQARNFHRRNNVIDRRYDTMVSDIVDSRLDPVTKVSSMRQAAGAGALQRAHTKNKLTNSRTIKSKNRFFGSGWRGAATYGVMGATGALFGGLSNIAGDNDEYY